MLGVLCEGEGVAAQVLVKLGASLDRARQQVAQLSSAAQQRPAGAAGSLSGPAEMVWKSHGDDVDS